MSQQTSQRILDHIATNPGQKAAEIARALDVDRKDVNSALYGPLKPKVEQDNQYRWYPAGTLRLAETRTASAAKLETPLAKLADYYIECIGQEGTGGVGVFASSKWPDYAELGSHPLLGHGKDPLSEPDAVAVLRKTRKRDGGQLSHFLGYPVLAKQIRSRRGWEGFILQPLLLHGVVDGAVETIPHINLEALESLTGSSQSSVLEEAIALARDLGLDQPIDELPDSDELVSRLASLREYWPWVEPSDLYELESSPPLSDVSDGGLYNRVIVACVERPVFTRGLETELGQLRAIKAIDYERTALGQWLTGVSEPSPIDAQPLLEALPMNAEQRQAVENALHNPLTVITGPPGTGKSQVVSSILINAAWRGMTTLFASKNNKAVDVVETRVNGLGPRPVVLRLGRGEYQARLSTYLAALMAATSSDVDQSRYEELQTDHAALTDRMDALQAQLQETINLRNELDALEIGVEQVREVCGEERFIAFASLPLESTRAAVGQLLEAVTRADKSQQRWLTRLIWFVRKQRRISNLLTIAREVESDLEVLGVGSIPAEGSEFLLEEWKASVDIAELAQSRAESAATYWALLDKLGTVAAPEAIAAESLMMVEEVASNSENLWNAWLRLQPSRLTADQRKLLGDYAATLQLIVAADADGRRAGGDVFRRFQALFPQIVESLPCWAITSLSVRGRVPFQPGFFDLLVVDEASQCDIASLLPLLFRSRRVVVIGDPMQLRHVSTLAPRQDEQLIGKHALADRVGWSYSSRSAFDLASSICRSEDLVTLRDHHRSHAHIIDFSNKEFYEERLRVVTRYAQLRTLPTDGPAVRWVEVVGKVVRPASGGAVNKAEAEAVVSELERIVIEQRYEGSVGVVSPFRAQANLVRDLVEGRPNLIQALAPAGFIADTVHRFQGDERDLMVFSPVISQGVHRGALMFLRSNPNLFNVAVTRARGGLIVVGDRKAARNSGVDYLSRFADYISVLGQESDDNGRARREDLGSQYPSVARPQEVSPWEEMLYEALYAAGIRTHPQVAVENYRLDLAVYVGQRKLDIEVDGERYHRTWTGEHTRRDQLRSQRLIELGWDVMRFWVYEIRDQIDSCVARVDDWVQTQKTSGQQV